MKKTFISFLMVMGYLLPITAQYAPNTKWPYLFDNFQEGTIYMVNNQKTEGKVNIHLLGSALHYLNNEQVLQADLKDVSHVEIGSRTFIPDDNKIMEVIAKKGSYSILKLITGDFESLLSSGGAYGSSSNTSATRDLSSLDIGGLNNPNHGLMLQEKTDGREVPLVIKFYLQTKDKQLFPANRKDIEKSLNEEQKVKWKVFLKSHKVKWKDEQRLAVILNFFN